LFPKPAFPKNLTLNIGGVLAFAYHGKAGAGVDMPFITPIPIIVNFGVGISTGNHL
jgi:hypothetical protein